MNSVAYRSDDGLTEIAEPGSGMMSHRILLIDDTQCIHDDFRKILCARESSELEHTEAALFDTELDPSSEQTLVLDSAYQGKGGLELIQQALAQGEPYALAIVDVRMPPGWDGIETAKRLWEADPHLQIVVCSAYSDYSWREMRRCLGTTDSLVFLKKPFDAIEVLQLVHALTAKWSLSRLARRQVEELERTIEQRTEQLTLANLTLQADNAVRRETQLRLAAFTALSNRLSAAQNAKAAAQIIVDVADQLLGWDACLCHLYSAEENQLFELLNMDLVDGIRSECTIEFADRTPTSLSYKAIHEGGHLILRDDPDDVESGVLSFGDKARRSASILYVPIRNGVNVIGVLSVQSYKKHTYDQSSLETLQALADHCGAALNRIRSEEILHHTEQQLLQAQKMEAIGQLAGGVAHDFNNLLAVILGNAECAMTEPSQEKVGEFLREVIDAANRAATLTRQLLAFSRKSVFKGRPLDLNKQIAQTSKMLQRIIGEDIDVRYTYADGLPFVRADSGMLDQVVMNLAVNSRDAMPGGGVLQITTKAATIDVSDVHSRPEARVGRFVSLSVSDTGTGISPENLSRIFEPFFTTKGVGKGTGLGLATVFGIVKQHQGWVEVNSKVGVGTVFEVFLPAVNEIEQRTSPAGVKAGPSGGKEVILLVEDDEALRRITRLLLEAAGYQIVEAVSGVDALKVWEEQSEKIDMLLTDIIMPGGLNGRALAERLAAEKPGMKVIFMSGYSRDIMTETGVALNNFKNRFLKKPCSRDELLRTIRELLDDREAFGSPSSSG
jgi:signal transduction histidine kinase/DNA-binding NtrC family response regulator